jgi:hypothetical protein
MRRGNRRPASSPTAIENHFGSADFGDGRHYLQRIHAGCIWWITALQLELGGLAWFFSASRAFDQ